MAQRKGISGLVKRNEIWYIDKVVKGRRICESTRTSDYREAEKVLANRIDTLREEVVYGVRSKRTFAEAAIRYVQDKQEKRSLEDDKRQLKNLYRYIGELPIEAVHMGTLRDFIDDRKTQGVKNRTINSALQVVRHLLNLAAGEWFDEQGRPWIDHAPKIKLLQQKDAKRPYPLSWEEQDRLFNELPSYLAKMALFKVNTGTRDHEVCNLRWSWEARHTGLDTSFFLIPDSYVKNGEERLVVLNDIAMAVVEEMRGQHPEFVFSYRGHQVRQMNQRAWKKARIRAGLPQVRVHDLKHTFGLRLRAAGVPEAYIKDLLGHKSRDITCHYSEAELTGLVEASNKVCVSDSRKSHAPTVLKRQLRVVGAS